LSIKIGEIALLYQEDKENEEKEKNEKKTKNEKKKWKTGQEKLQKSVSL